MGNRQANNNSVSTQRRTVKAHDDSFNFETQVEDDFVLIQVPASAKKQKQQARQQMGGNSNNNSNSQNENNTEIAQQQQHQANAENNDSPHGEALDEDDEFESLDLRDDFIEESPQELDPDQADELVRSASMRQPHVKITSMTSMVTTSVVSPHAMEVKP